MPIVDLGKFHPTVYRHVAALGEAAEKAALATGLDYRLLELVKIRVSQINGCAFCLRLHSRDALDCGETADRLAVLAAWWESQYFSDQERAALAIAEQITRLETPRLPVNLNALTDEQTSAASWVAVIVNTWNRVAIQSGYAVSPPG